MADQYNRLRSGPSDEALDWLIPDRAPDVLEIGAGTGILTRLLADRVVHLTAVEPDERMRAVLAASESRVEVLAGPAEEMPATTSSVDLVIAQSAWHWVDEERAVPEVARVSRPGGRLSLVWTGPDRSVDWMRSLWAGGIIFSPRSAEKKTTAGSVGTSSTSTSGSQPFLLSDTAVFRWTRPMAKADLVALSGTSPSAVITMDQETRLEHLEAITRFLDSSPGFADLDLIEVPMRSYCWRATKRSTAGQQRGKYALRIRTKVLRKSPGSGVP